jgi:hypothetical protein
MKREDIIRMAREAGWSGIYSKPLMSIAMQEDDFLRFAALVAAAEREKFIDYPKGEVCGPCVCGSWPGGDCLRCPPTEEYLAAIRARGEV